MRDSKEYMDMDQLQKLRSIDRNLILKINLKQVLNNK